MTLEIKHKNPKQEWMSAPFIQRVFTALQGSIPADEPQALLVGGCVRNVLLDKPVEDVDIATPLEPDAVIHILEKEEIKVIPTGIKHGTVTAVSDGVYFEITTLRCDEKTDGRHAEVSFTQDWIEDAKRRDFTFNTLLMDLEGNVYDPLGCGIEAAQKRQVCFVGPPSQRIEEDYLRILRFFRFSVLYADKYDEQGLQACQEAAVNIKQLSRERITQEFFKIISSDKPHEVLEVMFSHDVLSDLPPEEYDAKFFEHFCTFQLRYGLQALGSRLLVFAGLILRNIEAMGVYLLVPKVFIKDATCILGSLALSDLNCDHAIHESLYRFGRSATAQALMIELVQDRVMNGYAPTALNTIQTWDIPDFPITGKDMIKQGFKSGLALGREMERLEQLWIDNGFKIELFDVKPPPQS
jgi:poly(A) polymerase